MELLKSIDQKTRKLLYRLTIALFLALGALLLANVCLRLVNDFANFLNRHGLTAAAGAVTKIMPFVSLHWFDEIVEMCFAGLVFYGAAALWAIKGHFSVGDFISSHLPGPRWRAFYKAIVTAVCAVFMAIFFWFSLRLTLRSTELTTVFQMPKSFLYSCMPLSSLIMLAYSSAELCADVKRLLSRDTCADVATQEFKSL